ncbi:MAG: arginine--tRNA ligase [Nanoarchaeota archaeon]|nr:arginine--tRNA ligase [Nanoarchaeota archaeon]
MDFKTEIAKSLSKILGKTIGEETIEVPPNTDLGDYAFPCFSLAKELKKSPIAIAQELAGKIKPDSYISSAKATGPYVNFFVKKESLSEKVLKDVFEKKKRYGANDKKSCVMIESPGPNTNKPLHLGHVRNIVLGNSLVEIFKFLGHKTLRVDIINDRGVHICKSMLAYKLYGHGKQPDKKSDHYVGDFYVKYAIESEKHPEFEQEIQQMLVKWEEGDKETRELWKKMSDWALSGFKVTYDRYGVKMDKPYYESDHYLKGKDIALEGLKKGLFEKDEKGNVCIDFTDKGLGKKILLRADGTSIYITQDMALAEIRDRDYHMDKMIYVVGNEQIHHFKVLFEIFKLLKFKFADDCFHLAYGMVNLPEGKMKSREGKVVDADDLADEMHKTAAEELRKRYPDLGEKELEKRAEQIGMGAIKFFILKFDPMGDFTFNPKESISFEGETGPYVQYTHARCASILRKHGKSPKEHIDYSKLVADEEKNLMLLLNQFPEIVEKAAENYKPSLVTRYLLDLCQAFNEYYHRHQIVQDDKTLEEARVLLVACVKQVLENGLGVLGIEAPDVM